MGSQQKDMYDGQFSNILNFRDVGKTINDFLGEKLIKEGRIYRSARLDDATISDRQRIKDHYGIKTILDLRTLTEHDKQAKKRAIDIRDPRLVNLNSALKEPMKIPGIEYMEINVNGKGFERSLVWQLSPYSLMKLIGLMGLGYRLEAIGILGRQVLQPRGLIGLSFDTIHHCGPELASVLRTYCSPSDYPILAHCTQGKDRTGLIIALVLFILEIPIEAISHDYLMSEEKLLPERESRLKEIHEIGLSDDFAGCPVDFVEKTYEYLINSYGTVENYLTTIGFTEDERTALVRELMA
ncbi:e404122d-0e0b-4db1-9a70-2c4508633024 [Sclerotinia trifoliorum]|uniref:E404122d-0e0b-4db1-9a70-2c4508633024 n=1 Tax=Sclerotinia trifoliorum TaxID=28548 RepID=A0A8H2ZMH5_9HELO|nr:e404122d-0e0b-4db1-9a70-2c4508633024 [Sclerotinia trifoliorum]